MPHNHVAQRRKEARREGRRRAGLRHYRRESGGRELRTIPGETRVEPVTRRIKLPRGEGGRRFSAGHARLCAVDHHRWRWTGCGQVRTTRNAPNSAPGLVRPTAAQMVPRRLRGITTPTTEIHRRWTGTQLGWRAASPDLPKAGSRERDRWAVGYVAPGSRRTGADVCAAGGALKRLSRWRLAPSAGCTLRRNATGRWGVSMVAKACCSWAHGSADDLGRGAVTAVLPRWCVHPTSHTVRPSGSLEQRARYVPRTPGGAVAGARGTSPDSYSASSAVPLSEQANEPGLCVGGPSC